MAMYKTRATGTGNGMRGTRTTLYSRECRQTFQGMLLNIPGNVLKNSGECPETFRGMSPNISWNVGMLPIFGVNEGNYWAESQLHSCQTSTMEFLCENGQHRLFPQKSATADVNCASDWMCCVGWM